MIDTSVVTIEVEPPSWAELKARYGADEVGFVAELAKLTRERKLMHEMLNHAGIPTHTPLSKGLCLIARLAIAIERSSNDRE